VGVPGLNMVQVQYERDAFSTSSTDDGFIKRHEIDRLVTRAELDATPFQEPVPHQDNDDDEVNHAHSNPKKRNVDQKTTRERDVDQRRTDDSRAHSNGQTRRHQERPSETSTMQPPPKITWVIPHIRVRIVTKRYGREYYKEKGVVVDVTSAGATIQMDNNRSNSSSSTVLDRVPERHVETALPKVGGRVILLADDDDNNDTATTAQQQHHSSSAKKRRNKFDKGRLLERTASHGVVQVHHDMSVWKVPLDDLAEWCGPLDDDEAD
jgi:KN17 SH3-like C-terminal domain